MSLHVAIDAVSASGGGAVVVLELLRGWREAGVELRSTVISGAGEVLTALEREGTADEIVAVGAGGTIIGFARQLTQVPRIVQKVRAHVVLCTNHWLPRITVPLVVHHQNSLRFVGHEISRRRPSLGDRLRDSLARAALRRAAANVFISHYLRRMAERLVPSSAPRNHVVYNSVPSAWFTGSVERHATTNSILAVTSAANYKGIDTLLKMLASLRDKRPRAPWRLTIVGAEGKRGRWREHRRLAGELGVDGSISWRGPVPHEELLRLYRTHGCLVSTSWLEGFGLPVAEAVVCGCPVIAADAAATPEIAGSAAILAPSHDAEAFAQAVLRVLEQPDVRERLRRSGLLRRRLFDSAANAESFFHVLRRAAFALDDPPGASVRETTAPSSPPDVARA